MSEKVFLTAFFLSAIYITVDCIVTSPGDIEKCDRGNITIPWNYTEPADMSTVSWHFITGTGTTLIMLQAQGTNADVKGGFNIEHLSNGEVKLINPTTANTGTYRITVTYSTSAPNNIDEVGVIVFGRPAGLSYSSLTSGKKTNFTCTVSDLGGPVPATLYIQVDDEERSDQSATVNKDRADVLCCLKDGPAICLQEKCVTAQIEVLVSTYLVISIIAVGLTSVVIIVLIFMIFVRRQGKVVIWNLSRADIAVIIVGCVVALYSLIAGAVSAANHFDEDKYCDTDTHCNASFGLGIASIVLAGVGVVVLVVFIKVRKGGFGKRLSCLNTVLPVCKDTEARGPPDGKSDHPTAKDKQREVKLLTHKEQTKQHQKETEVNKGKHEEVFKGRPLPHPTGNNRNDTGSAGAVSRQDVVLDRRPMPDIPSDRHRRGLSANFHDEADTPLDDNILHTLPDAKKSRKALDPVNTEGQSKNPDDQPKKKKKKKKNPDTSRSEEMEDNIDSHGKVLEF